MAERKIEDFGEKLEGARKDLAALRKGLMQLNDDTIDRWSDAEREQYITKDLAWKKPDYQKMLDNGIPKEVIYFIKQVRDAVPVRPAKKDEAWQRGYVNFVSEVRDTVMSIQSPSDFAQVCELLKDKFLEKSGYHSYKNSHDAWGSFTNKLFQALQKTPSEIQYDVARKQFLYTDEEKNFAKHIMLIASPQQFYRTAGKEATLNGGKPAVRLEMYSSQHSYRAVVFSLPEGANMSDTLDRLSTDCADCESNKWFVVTRDNRLLVSGIDSQEEAKKIAQEYANGIELAVEEAKKLREQQRQTNAPDDNYSEKRKSKLLPPQLESIQRYGEEHRQDDRNITGEDILAAFSLRGGQFGNWTNQNDRQTSMNMAFDALRDLAVALDIAYTDIALKQTDDKRTGSLGIAFGARGHSSALAHYEPLENVINLTKMKGAGSLAHEWGHALDSYVMRELHLDASAYAEKSQKYMASHCYLNGSQDNPFKAVVEAMRWKTGEDGSRITTDYYKQSQKTDKSFSKTDNGYWSSNCEMFARAFACYVHDKLEEKGIRSDYLCGHSEFTVFPKGEERQLINQAIDGLIQDMKEKGLLHHQVHDIPAEMLKAPEAPAFKPHEPAPETDFGEQMSLFDMMNEPEPEAVAEMPLPQEAQADPVSEPEQPAVPKTFDFHTVADAGLMLREEFMNDNGESVIRAVLEEHTVQNLESEDLLLLFERAGIQDDAGITKLMGGELTICVDFYDNGDAEAVLRANRGIICAGEFPMLLSPEEKQVFEVKVQQELGSTLTEEHDKIRDYAVSPDKNMEMTD